jgi:hypothetical protein
MTRSGVGAQGGGRKPHMGISAARTVGRRAATLRRVAALAGVSLLVALGAIAVNDARASAVRPPYQVTLPDLEIAVPTGLIGVGPDPNNPGGTDPYLQFTHITWDAGAGPFELKPKYNKRTGISTFSQVLFKSRGGGSWRKAYSVPLARTGIFLPGESHYRFPLTSFTLNQMNSDGSLGAVVATSPKTDYCIQGDTEVGGVPNTPNHDFIPQSDCAHPNAALGWSVGWGDEYDETDPGQPIDLVGLPTNTDYILHATVDPDDLFTESNKSDNVTDTVLSFTNTDGSSVIDSNTAVQAMSQTGPYDPLGNMSVELPARGATVHGTMALTAALHPVRGRTVKSVQYLLDGEPLGPSVTASPFAYNWAVGDTSPGPHTLSAQATDSSGAVMTAPVRSLTVRSASADRAHGVKDTPPTASIVNPAPGQTVSGTVPVAADASDNLGIRSVQFELDGRALGAPVTAAPYALSWTTTSVSSGNHTVSAVATNDSGKVASSPPVTVDVLNPAPPMACFVLQTEKTAAGRGSVTTPRFLVAFGGEDLVAFVSAGGGQGQQRATVSGGGLHWRLVRRSDAQSGDLEVWTATAPRATPAMTVTSSLAHPDHSEHLTVIALEGSDGVGASSTASGASGSAYLQLATTEHTSLVYALVQNAGSGAGHLPFGWVPLSRATAGGHPTSWVQLTNQATGPAGSVIRVDDGHTNTPWNAVAVELVNDD